MALKDKDVKLRFIAFAQIKLPRGRRWLGCDKLAPLNRAVEQEAKKHGIKFSIYVRIDDNGN